MRFTEGQKCFKRVNCHEDSVIELLEFIMNDQTKSIEHFIHSLDYGRTCRDGMGTDSYVNGIDCRSVESLYDSLLKEGSL